MESYVLLLNKQHYFFCHLFLFHFWENAFHISGHFLIRIAFKKFEMKIINCNFRSSSSFLKSVQLCFC